MGYWNRDLSEPLVKGNRSPETGSEPLKAWHDGCFPIELPSTAEKFLRAGATNEDYAAHIYGGIDHLIELAMTSAHYATSIEQTLTDTTRWTPDGYAWANWQMGTLCDVCGEPC